MSEKLGISAEETETIDSAIGTSGPSPLPSMARYINTHFGNPSQSDLRQREESTPTIKQSVRSIIQQLEAASLPSKTKPKEEIKEFEASGSGPPVSAQERELNLKLIQAHKKKTPRLAMKTYRMPRRKSKPISREAKLSLIASNSIKEKVEKPTTTIEKVVASDSEEDSLVKDTESQSNESENEIDILNVLYGIKKPVITTRRSIILPRWAGKLQDPERPWYKRHKGSYRANISSEHSRVVYGDKYHKTSVVDKEISSGVSRVVEYLTKTVETVSHRLEELVDEVASLCDCDKIDEAVDELENNKLKEIGSDSDVVVASPPESICSISSESVVLMNTPKKSGTDAVNLLPDISDSEQSTRKVGRPPKPKPQWILSERAQKINDRNIGHFDILTDNNYKKLTYPKEKEDYLNAVALKHLKKDEENALTLKLIRPCYSMVLRGVLSEDEWIEWDKFSKYCLVETDTKPKIIYGLNVLKVLEAAEPIGYIDSPLLKVWSHAFDPKDENKVKFILAQFKFTEECMKGDEEFEAKPLVEREQEVLVRKDSGEIAWIPIGNVGPKNLVIELYKIGKEASGVVQPLKYRKRKQVAIRKDYLHKKCKPDLDLSKEIKDKVMKSFINQFLMKDRASIYNKLEDTFESLTAQMWFYSKFMEKCDPLLRETDRMVYRNLVGNMSPSNREKKDFKKLMDSVKFPVILKQSTFVNAVKVAFQNRKTTVLALLAVQNEKNEIIPGNNHCYVIIIRKLITGMEFYLMDTMRDHGPYRGIPYQFTWIRDKLAPSKPDIKRIYGKQVDLKNCFTIAIRLAGEFADDKDFIEKRHFMIDNELRKSCDRMKL